jgi:hypothetical protein
MTSKAEAQFFWQIVPTLKWMVTMMGMPVKGNLDTDVLIFIQ